jgi:hypothetical protein
MPFLIRILLLCATTLTGTWRGAPDAALPHGWRLPAQAEAVRLLVDAEAMRQAVVPTDTEPVPEEGTALVAVSPAPEDDETGDDSDEPLEWIAAPLPAVVQWPAINQAVRDRKPVTPAIKPSAAPNIRWRGPPVRQSLCPVQVPQPLDTAGCHFPFALPGSLLRPDQSHPLRTSGLLHSADAHFGNARARARAISQGREANEPAHPLSGKPSRHGLDVLAGEGVIAIQLVPEHLAEQKRSAA